MDVDGGTSPAQLRAVSVAPGRRRKPEPEAAVTVVLASGEQVVLPSDSALARAIAQVSALLAYW